MKTTTCTCDPGSALRLKYGFENREGNFKVDWPLAKSRNSVGDRQLFLPIPRLMCHNGKIIICIGIIIYLYTFGFIGFVKLHYYYY